MHQTTVRFGADLWDELVRAADRAGVSVAQYVREAAVARLARGGAHAHPGDALRPTLRSDAAARLEGATAMLAPSGLTPGRSTQLRREALATREHRGTFTR